ncbi:MAG TPA: 23S rRNA (uracil(1939)-C(5))-methyltransferase RlmD, partial [Roseiflexaceae bacterium]|nr:23S rRNA (uracil(1939)-C(5))-methyltransferase RlmD [Roseiflexaceae bacterium]
LDITDIAQGGDGVGRWEGRVVFARGGLPGERVRVAVRERRSDFAKGEVVAVLEASPDRVEPRDPRGDHMPWQHIAYEAQLRFKRQILSDQLAKFGGLAEMMVEETVPAARQWNYRNSAHLHYDGRRLGYYAAESHTIHTFDTDPLLLPQLDEMLAELRTALAATAPRQCEITLRASESYGYNVAALSYPAQRLQRHDRATSDMEQTLGKLAGRWRDSCPALAGVTIQSRPPVQLGADHLVEELGGIAFHLRPTTFFQVNRASAETLLRLARAGLALHDDARLLDLYCGTGAFSLPLANEVAAVVGVEEHPGAVEDARTTATQNGVNNARFENGLVERTLERLNQDFDAAILDPPRRGCHPLALAALLRVAPARLVYISCHPATLARDLKALTSGGYRVVSVRPVDLFPQTPHIESVSVLVRE